MNLDFLPSAVWQALLPIINFVVENGDFLTFVLPVAMVLCIVLYFHEKQRDARRIARRRALTPLKTKVFNSSEDYRYFDRP